MKIRLNLNETSTAGSVYSAPSMESQEQQLPSDEELAIRDKEEAERQEQQAEKDRKEADKKAKEKAAKLPPADKAPGDSAAPKDDAAGDEESEDDEEESEDDEDTDDDSDDSDDSEDDDEDLDDLDEDDEEATAAAIVPVAEAPATPRNRPYPDAYVEAIPDAIFPQTERELTEEEKAVQLEKENEKPQGDNADVILPDKPKENVGAPKTENKEGDTDNKSAAQEVATASAVRVRPYPDCWD